jgi:hypothetical protein
MLYSEILLICLKHFSKYNVFLIHSSTFVGRSSFDFFLSSLELSLEWLCRALWGGEGAGELPDVVDVGVPPVSLLLLLSVVADEGRPTCKIRTGLSSYSSIPQCTHK